MVWNLDKLSFSDQPNKRVDEGVPSYEEDNQDDERQQDEDEEIVLENPKATKKNNDEFNGWSASYNVDEYNSEESKEQNRFTYQYEDDQDQKKNEYQSQISFKFQSN